MNHHPESRPEASNRSNDLSDAFQALSRNPSDPEALRRLAVGVRPPHRTTIAIPMVGNRQWQGGVVYVHLMAIALRSLPKEKQPRIVFLVRKGEEGSLDLYAPFLPLFDGVVLVGFPAHETPEVGGISVVRAVDIPQAHSHFDVLYPMRPLVMPGVHGASWIPDFQHRHLPEFFSPQDLEKRDASFREVARTARICVFSSRDAEKDFRTFYPESRCRTHILHFFHQLPDAAFQRPVEPVVEKYGLRRGFILCCNQFWIHKGHDTLFPAFAELAKEFPDIDLACTGGTEDYRNSGYFGNLLEFLRSNGLESRVKILGLIPRDDQLQLLRASMGVVHPSRFEGWSTVVEDCRSLGKPMVLTDLGVHLEQEPPESVFFRTGDVGDLAAKLRETLPTWKPGPDAAAEASARADSERNIRRYGEELLALCSRIQDAFAEDDGAMRCLEEASRLLDQNRSSEVEVALDRAPVLESEDARIQRAAGNLLLRAGLLNQARAKFLLSTRLDPGDAEAHLDLGVAWTMQARYPEAEASLRKALELSPGNGEVWKNLGRLHLRRKETVAGVEAYSKAMELLPEDPECLVLVGGWLALQGDSGRARTLLEKASVLCPQDAGIRAELEKLSPPRAKDISLETVPVPSLTIPPRGSTEKFLPMVPIGRGTATSAASHWIGKLSIRDFGTGEAAFRGIVRHILEAKVGTTGNLDRIRLDGTIVFPLSLELGPRRGRDSAGPFPRLADLDPEFAASEGPVREADILAYRDRFAKGEEAPPASFVTGAYLNSCGADVDPDELWMIDGARRIAAQALLGRSPVQAEVLTTESHYATLITETDRAALRQRVKDIRWFASYQSIPLVGLEGDRTTNRFGLMDLSLLRECRVADWGCNLGQASLRAALAGASEVVGLEGMPDTFAAASEIRRLSGLSNLRFAQVDFNAPDLDARVDAAVQGKVDWSFFFSVYRTKELVQRDRLFQKIIDKTAKGIFFEGHADKVIDTVDYYRWLFESYGLDWKHLGNSEGDLRPLFLLTWDKSRQRRQSPFQGSAPAVLPGRVPDSRPDPVRPTPSEPTRRAPDAGNGNPLVTAIVSAYASAGYLRGRLENLLSQTLGDRLEIVVIDSCSPENDAEIAREYARRDPRVRVVRTPERETIYKAWNRGVEMARGKYLTNANADDILREDALERLAAELDSHPGIDLAYGDFWITHEPNQTFRGSRRIGYSLKPEFDRSIMLSGCHMGPQPMWRRSLHDRYGLFDPEFHAAGDYEFWCRCVAGGSVFRHVPEFLGLYLHNQVGLCNGDVPRVVRESAEVQRRYGERLPAPPPAFRAEGFYRKEPLPENGGFVNIGMVTWNRLEFTKQAIEAVWRKTKHPHVLTVVDNGSNDGTREWLGEMHRQGIISNLILLPENVGVARASNIAWSAVPDAAFFLKLDSDMVALKPDWLERMVDAAERIPSIGALGYSVEPKSYPLEVVDGVPVRPKRDANIGGACFLVPRSVHERLGWWCEDYGLYGEEDGDFALRIRLAGLFNAYMEDEDAFRHLPGGKAGAIDPRDLSAIDPEEIRIHEDYRLWKDDLRRELQKNGGILQRNVVAYHSGQRSLFVPRGRFQGLLGQDLQVFLREDLWEFHPVSGEVTQAQREAVDGFSAARSLGDVLAQSDLSASRRFLSVQPVAAGETKPTTTIVIPVHGHLDLTRQCLEAVRKTIDPSTTEIVVVDDASPDDTALWLREQASRGILKAIYLSPNRGFATACNAGAKAASGKTLVFLNNDTIPEAGWLDALVRTLERNPSAGMVGSRLLYPNRTIQHAGIQFHPGGMPFHVHRGKPADDPSVLVAKAFPAVTGACIAIPSDLFGRLGGFDESFHMYVEDVDLCIKVWDAGREVLYCPDSVVVHLESASASDLERRDSQVREGLGKLHARWSGRWPRALSGVEGFPPAFLAQAAPPRNAAKALWISPIWDPSGYGDESRSFLAHLSATDIGLSTRAWGRHSETFHQNADPSLRALLDPLLDAPVREGVPVVLDMPGSALGRVQGAGHHIGRTTFETDGLPPDWVHRCDGMDEIWVPSRFNLETFRSAGVTKPILVVPEGVDTNKFRPGLRPLEIPGPKRGTTFLSVFEWTHRKGPDVLLRAWARAFGPDDDVRLVLRTYPPNEIEGDPARWVDAKIEETLREAGSSRSRCAPILVIARQVPDADMPRLYAAADVYLAPSRGEGWGRPHMEAMSCGVPVVATRWSGNLDFQDDNNSWLLDIEGLEEIDAKEEFPFYRGQKWSRPSVEHLAKLLGTALDPDLRRSKGGRARKDMVERWDWSRIAPLAETRLREILAGVPASASALGARPVPAKPVPEPGAGGSVPTFRWCGDLFNFSGYAGLARNAVAGLMDASVPVTADPQRNDRNWFPGISPADRTRWTDLLSRAPLPGVLVCCDVPRDATGRNELFDQMAAANPGNPKRAGWTMFETDRLPAGWADSLNRLDEVWVPSEFNRRTFSAAGVDPGRIHVVPGSVDVSRYGSGLPHPLPGGRKGTTFLSVFQWVRRKGWDVLLRAWAEAFDPKADVRLVLRCHPFGKDASPMRDRFLESLDELGLAEAKMAPIVLLDGFVPESGMPSLYLASDVFVLPSRGEGWGLPYLEAMASGKPCIATAWGASTDFLNEENAWLASPRETVPVGEAACRENPYLSPDHRWADPDPAEVARLLRRAASNIVERERKGIQARFEAATRWNPEITARAIAARGRALLGLAEPVSGRTYPPLRNASGTKLSGALEKVAEGLLARGGKHASATPTEPEKTLSIRWEGSQFVHHSLALVNRELCARLAKRGHDLSLIPWEPDQFGAGDDPDLAILERLRKAPLEGPCQVHVRHQWPPLLEPPEEGKWVVVQPWEFGSPPLDWMPVFRDRIDALWVPSTYCRDLYARAGVPGDRIRVVPNGVDTDRFRPGLQPLPGLEPDGRVNFLFVGGTIARKGFDVLLGAWKRAFGPSDPVRLVVKAMGGESFYKGQTGEAMVQELNASGTCAPVIYLDQDLSLEDLPRIYASGDVLVHPYRGEGFGLPIAEAMSCGLPVVVTRGGASDDFCGDAESWGIPAMRMDVPGGVVGPFRTVAAPWWLEPSAEKLAEILRDVAGDEPGRRARGRAGRKRILSNWTWDHAADAAEAALLDVVRRPGVRRDRTEANPSDAPMPNATTESELLDLNRILFRAEAAAGRGEFDEAEAATREAVEAHPDQHLAWLARAMVLRGLRKFPSSIEAVQKSIALRESPDALLESVLIHRSAGQESQAKLSAKRLKEQHGGWLAATRALYASKGQPWPLDPPRKNAKKSNSPSLKGRK